MTSGLGTELLLERNGIKKSEVASIAFRGNGWPGGMTIRTCSGDKHFFPLNEYLDTFFGAFFHTPPYCLQCVDHVNELADISIGDAFLPEMKTEKNSGESFVICRTKPADQLICEAREKNVISAVKSKADDVRYVQRGMLAFKKKNIKARSWMLRRMGIQTPYRNVFLKTPSILGWIGSVLACGNVYLTRKKRTVMRVLPSQVCDAIKLLFFATNLR